MATTPHVNPTTMGELLGAFAFASDLAFGLQLEDSIRSCYMAMRLAERLGVSEQDRSSSYYTALLKDAGCTSWTSELARVWQTDEIEARRDLIIFSAYASPDELIAWASEHIARDLPPHARQEQLQHVLEAMPSLTMEAIATTAEVSGRIARRLGMPPAVLDALRHLFEHWDGEGAPDGLKGEQIPVASRLVLVSFIAVPLHRQRGVEATAAAIRRHSGTLYDPAVVDAFTALADDDDFWRELERPDLREVVVEMEPGGALAVGDERVDDIAFAFADFIDLKSRYAGSHSRRVARVSELLAQQLGSAPEAVVQIRRAALMHDIGLVALPSYSLEKPAAQLSASEVERYRLHPYHGERILQRVPSMSPFLEMVGNHQEGVDGSGYFRGLRGDTISLGARIIAVADRLDELTHDAPGRAALSADEALSNIKADSRLDASIVAVLGRALGNETAPSPHVWPAGLTKREVDVLRLAARGLTRAQIGAELYISENTVRHHLEHIYTKTGTTTRVAATLFAIENGLLA